MEETTQTGTEPTTEQTPAQATGETVEPAKDDGQSTSEGMELQVPEGAGFDEQWLASFKEKAQKENLTPEQAQARLNWEAERAVSHKEQAQKWSESLTKDEEFGGDKFDANVKVVQTFAEENFPKELVDMLNATGYSNNPAVVKTVWAVANKMKGLQTKVEELTKESPMHGIGLNAPTKVAPKSTKEILYPEDSK